MNMERLPRVLAALRKVAEQSGTSVARVALAWQLTKPFVTSVIIGAKRPDQLADNLAATDLKLSNEQNRSPSTTPAPCPPNIQAGWSSSKTLATPAVRSVFPAKNRSVQLPNARNERDP